MIPPRLPGASLCLLLLFLGLTGCVGPTTPLGAIDGVFPNRRAETGPVDEPEQPSPSGVARAGIEFTPPYQQVHDVYTWQVAIYDPSGKAPKNLQRVKVFYDELDVTRSTHAQFEIEYEELEEEGQEVLVLRMPHLRLDPLREHEIVVEYVMSTGEALVSEYRFPCLEDMAAQEQISTTEPFDPDPELLEAIREAGNRFGVNPVLLAALIAQESGYDPHALSRATALGLTQITHLTQQDISRQFPDWPTYPGICNLTRFRLKRLIPKVVNAKNEWRLDPVKSIQGGAWYLGYLKERLLHRSNQRFVENAGDIEGPLLAAASLAAYNSGLNRILYYMKRHGADWLDQRRTREAKRYARKVLSYYGAFRPGGSASPAGTGVPL